MVTKHFFKILFIFAGMIAMGLIGVFLVSFFDSNGGQTTSTDATTATPVAK